MDPATIAMLASAVGPLLSRLFGGGPSDAQKNLQPQQADLLGYQKYLIAMTDPSAAQMLGLSAAPQGALPMRPAINQAAFSMMPGFARQGLDWLQVPYGNGASNMARPRYPQAPGTTTEPSRRPKVITF